MTDSVGVFVDTNVLVYSLQADERKATIAQQIINEITNVQLRKFRRTVAQTTEVAAFLLAACDVRSLTVADAVLAHQLLAERSLSLRDSLVVASALNARCEVLLSEDM